MQMKKGFEVICIHLMAMNKFKFSIKYEGDKFGVNYSIEL